MKNGLYAIHIEMLDGVSGRNGGVMVLRDGIIRGGDSHFYYTGSYSFGDGKWKGELINAEHTPTHGLRPVFGGREVGIGFSGSYDDEGPTLARLHDEIMPAQGLTFAGPHHEIYLSDPRKTSAAKLKTILRQPVRCKRPSLLSERPHPEERTQ